VADYEGRYIGQQFGNYRLVELLDWGGFAEVYLGEHIHMGTQAAVKVLTAKLTPDEIAHFRNEARTIFGLEHPNIVRVLDYGLNGNIPYIVMGYAANGSLRKRHPRGTRVQLPTVVEYVKQVAAALQYAHDERLVHRDVKPHNMLIGKRNEILLSDFGIVTISSSINPSHLQERTGTWVYMAPEQIQKQPVRASDQYALGITVYEWLCGKPPFEGDWYNLYHQHLNVAPPPLRERAPDIPPAVESVVMRALAKDPKDRYPTVTDFANALEEAWQEFFAFLQAQEALLAKSYKCRWSNKDPGYMIIILDQSAAMSNLFGTSSTASQVAEMLNNSLQNLLSYDIEGDLFGDYRYSSKIRLTMLGYGNGEVRSLLPKETAEDGFCKLSELISHTARFEMRKRKEIDDTGRPYDIEVPFWVWIEPQAMGDSPMCKALQQAKSLAEEWVSKHPKSYPPVVIHITQGISSDGDPTLSALQLRQISTADGYTQLYNILISSDNIVPLTYPSDDSKFLGNLRARTLFSLTSILPKRSRYLLELWYGINISTKARGFAWNSNLVFLDLIMALCNDEFPVTSPPNPSENVP